MVRTELFDSLQPFSRVSPRDRFAPFPSYAISVAHLGHLWMPRSVRANLLVAQKNAIPTHSAL